jgi:hypothetical protein
LALPLEIKRSAAKGIRALIAVDIKDPIAWKNMTFLAEIGMQKASPKSFDFSILNLLLNHLPNLLRL